VYFQPLLGRKSYRVRRNNANYMAITPSKVVQGNRFWYHSKAHMLLPISDYLLSCTVSKLWLIIGQIFASDRGCFTLRPSLGVIPYEYPDKLYLFRN